MSRHKYGAVRTEVDGVKFASKAEARRYAELKMLEKAGKITGLGLQPTFKLRVGAQVIGKYIGDFDYWAQLGDGAARYVVEDVKGMKTAMYRWKAKHMKAEHGIEITEITR
jgi:hypothetical protein